MKGVSAAAVYKGLRGYWRKRKYEKLHGSSGRRRWRIVQLGSTPKRQRFWRIKITPKLRFLRRMPSPKKLLIWLRDAYVKMMLGFANSRVCSASYGGGISSEGMATFGKRPLKEYEEKMIVEIYKTLVLAQGQFARPESNQLGSEIPCRQ